MTEANQTPDNNTAGVAIVANHNPLIDTKEITFGFRKQTDPETKVETKRESIVAKIGVPSVEGIIDIIQNGGKGLEALQTAVEDALLNYARSIINDDSSITTANFDAASINWEAYANQPESERRGRGIAKEQWEAFIASYTEQMPAILGKPLENIKKQASILAQKFQPLRAHEKKNDILPQFKNALALYVNNVPEAEQFQDVVEFLIKKADQFMEQDNAADLEKNLGF